MISSLLARLYAARPSHLTHATTVELMATV
jgi:hypothetical protein